MIMKDRDVESNGEMMFDLNKISVCFSWIIILNFVLNGSWRAWFKGNDLSYSDVMTSIIVILFSLTVSHVSYLLTWPGLGLTGT